MTRDGSFHSHPCFHCHTPVECQGDVVRNYDGWPDPRCLTYHQDNGTVLHVLCVSCARPGCHICGAPSAIIIEDTDDASGYKGEIGLCQEHAPR